MKWECAREEYTVCSKRSKRSGLTWFNLSSRFHVHTYASRQPNALALVCTPLCTMQCVERTIALCTLLSANGNILLPVDSRCLDLVLHIWSTMKTNLMPVYFDISKHCFEGEVQCLGFHDLVFSPVTKLLFC
jgi:hypothetical protein